MLDRAQILALLKQLPSLPSAVGELLASFDSEDTDISRIARQIACDQALTARVLRVANSSFYGLQHKVGTINEAVVVLGFRAVRSMVLAVSINGAFRPAYCPGFDPQVYLRHSVATGIAARALAAQTGHNPDLAFTGGILHDIGQLVLAANFSQQYAKALAYRNGLDCFLVQAEREILGLDHAEVGGLLAEAWCFPAALREVVAEHHTPAAALAGSPADLIHVCDSIAHGLGLGQAAEEMVMPVERTAWQRLGLNADRIGRVLPLVIAGMDEACQALNC